MLPLTGFGGNNTSPIERGRNLKAGPAGEVSWVKMTETTERKRRNVLVEGEKLRGADKVRRIPLKVIPTDELPTKPNWIRVKIPASPRINHIKQKLREHKLASV